MLFEGVKLIFVGMGSVVLFLLFTIFLIQLVSRLAQGAARKELEAIELERERRGVARQKAVSGPQDFEDDIVVIAAAVARYESEVFAR